MGTPKISENRLMLTESQSTNLPKEQKLADSWIPLSSRV